MFGKLFRRQKDQAGKTKRQHPNRKHTCHFETLEERRLLAADFAFSEFLGSLNESNSVERIDITVAPEHLGMEGDGLIGFELEGRTSSPFDPAAIRIVNSAGKLITPTYQ
ncbi:MAG: hypothetical protein SGJ20_16360, partial [Planctomycetota bacterium]|nr:hypothetical protein [Planctomycetota bacterium]